MCVIYPVSINRLECKTVIETQNFQNEKEKHDARTTRQNRPCDRSIFGHRTRDGDSFGSCRSARDARRTPRKTARLTCFVYR